MSRLGGGNTAYPAIFNKVSINEVNQVNKGARGIKKWGKKGKGVGRRNILIPHLGNEPIRRPLLAQALSARDTSGVVASLLSGEAFEEAVGCLFHQCH